MFVDAIVKATQYTKAYHLLVRRFNSKTVEPNAATLFMINADGWALTCGHVAKTMLAVEQINATYTSYKNELQSAGKKAINKQHKKKLKAKYKYTNKSPIQMTARFMGCVDKYQKIDIKLHDDYDVALLHFVGAEKVICDEFPIFIASNTKIMQGQAICRLGYPFPEFSNFKYDEADDNIQWTKEGRSQTPTFPIEGMVTRRLSRTGDDIYGFEMSTPGLRGQSGGPAFDREGLVWGMQAQTAHLDLNFDINQQVMRDGKKKKVEDSAFLHVGHCIHADILKSFMREHDVAFAD